MEGTYPGGPLHLYWMTFSNVSLSLRYLIILRNMKQDYTMPQYFLLARKHLLANAFIAILDSIIPPKPAQLCNFILTEDSPVFWSGDSLRIQKVNIYKSSPQCEAVSVLFPSVFFSQCFISQYFQWLNTTKQTFKGN